MITQANYWTEIESLAKEAIKEAKEYDIDLTDLVHEAVDNHTWNIYNSYHLSILQHSDNEDAGAEFLPDQIQAGQSDWHEIVATMVFFALRADVLDKVNKLK